MIHEAWKSLQLRRKSGEGNGTPLQYSCLENPMGGGVWWAAVHGVAKSWIRLSDFTFTFHLHALEKEMATHSSVLAWRIPGLVEPEGLLSMGSHRAGCDWSDLAAAARHVALYEKNFCKIYIEGIFRKWNIHQKRSYYQGQFIKSFRLLTVQPPGCSAGKEFACKAGDPS